MSFLSEKDIKNIDKMTDIFADRLKNGKIKKDELPNYDVDYGIDEEEKDFENYEKFLNSELGKVVINAMNK